MLPSGIYEQVINRLISSELNCDENIIKTESINSEEAAKILAQYFRELLEEGLENLKDNGGNILKQIELCNKLVDVIAAETNTDFIKKLMIDEQAELLIAYLQKEIIYML